MRYPKFIVLIFFFTILLLVIYNLHLKYESVDREVVSKNIEIGKKYWSVSMHERYCILYIYIYNNNYICITTIIILIIDYNGSSNIFATRLHAGCGLFRFNSLRLSSLMSHTHTMRKGLVACYTSVCSWCMKSCASIEHHEMSLLMPIL